MERVGIVGPELELSLGWSAGSGSIGSGCCVPLQNKQQRGDRRGFPVCAPMPKLVLSCGEKISTV